MLSERCVWIWTFIRLRFLKYTCNEYLVCNSNNGQLQSSWGMMQIGFHFIWMIQWQISFENSDCYVLREWKKWLKWQPLRYLVERSTSGDQFHGESSQVPSIIYSRMISSFCGHAQEIHSLREFQLIIGMYALMIEWSKICFQCWMHEIDQIIRNKKLDHLHGTRSVYRSTLSSARVSAICDCGNLDSEILWCPTSSMNKR